MTDIQNNPVALIDVQSEENASGDVAKVYAEMKEAWHMVPNPMKLFSADPALLRHRWEGFKIMGENTSVDPMFQTLLRMLVSVTHDCDYCVGLNESMLIGMFEMTPEQVAAMKKDPATAPLPEKQKALLLFVLKAVKAPKSTTKTEIEALHALGWSDADIFFAMNYATDMVATDILINAFHVARDY